MYFMDLSTDSSVALSTPITRLLITKYYPPTKNGGGLWSDDSLFQVRDGEKYLPDNKKMF